MDDRNQRGAADRQRINANEDYEVRYWALRLGTTVESLRAAVEAVGPQADAVTSYLQQRTGTTQSH